MFAYKSTLSRLALLALTQAHPTEPVNTTITTRGINPFSGVSFDPFAGGRCDGEDQGNTNVNLGTTACPNVSEAGSYSITADLCSEAKLTYFTDFDCKGKVTQILQKGAGCYARQGKFKSIRVEPTVCQF